MFWGFVDTGFAPGAVEEGGPGWSQVWVPKAQALVSRSDLLHWGDLASVSPNKIIENLLKRLMVRINGRGCHLW